MTDHEHCRDMGRCWQDREPCPALTDVLAWELIDYDGPLYIRIVGGRTLYDSVMIRDGWDGGNVRLVRLQPVFDDQGFPRIRQINRYVDPDTPVELVAK